MNGEGGGSAGGGRTGGGEFDGVDDEQLEQFAFGRQGRVYDRELAEAALLELIRRGAARSAVAGSGSVSSGTALDDHATDEPVPGDDEPPRPHDRRMRATGRAGLVLALLALLGVAPLLTPLPAGDNPLAVFDRPATADDEAWVDRLAPTYVTAITLGPRTVELSNGLIAIVFRAAATVDGRSTDYDPYCLWVNEGGLATAPGALSGSCARPDRFAEEGIAFALYPSADGRGVDVVSWGPTGEPTLSVNQPVPAIGGVRSVLDWLVFPSSSTGDPRAVADDLSRVLMGPSIVPLNNQQGAGGLDVTTWAYLTEGRADDAPVLCIVTFAGDPATPAVQPRETRTCAPLTVVRRQGLAHTVTSGGLAWEVLIGPDGEGRSDRVQPADGPR